MNYLLDLRKIIAITNWTPNGLRYAPHAVPTDGSLCGVLVGGIGHHPGALPGRDNATLTEPTSSHANCLKTRTLRSNSPTRRVHLCMTWASCFTEAPEPVLRRLCWAATRKVRLTL